MRGAMAFCPRCKSLLFPVDGKPTCRKCGFVQEKSASTIVTAPREQREILVMDDEARKKLEVMPTMRAECPKCGNLEAYYRTQQTRKSDEPETAFLRCTKCDHRWRRY